MRVMLSTDKTINYQDRNAEHRSQRSEKRTTYAIPEGRCYHCQWRLESSRSTSHTVNTGWIQNLQSQNVSCSGSLKNLRKCGRCAKGWKTDNMDDYDHGPGNLQWTTYEYQLLDRFSEYAVNERGLWMQRVPDVAIREIVMDIAFDVV